MKGSGSLFNKFVFPVNHAQSCFLHVHSPTFLVEFYTKATLGKAQTKQNLPVTKYAVFIWEFANKTSGQAERGQTKWSHFV